MKRKLALLLALVMVISMLPMTAFAASDNYVDRVVNVQEDDVLGTQDEVDAEDADHVAPNLVIVNDRNTWRGEQVFRLRLTNAEWNVSTNVLRAAINEDGDVVSRVDRINDRTVQVTVYDTNNAATPDELVIPLFTEITDEGEATVTIEPMNSAISAGTYTFAVATDGDVVVTIDGTPRFSGTNSRKLDQIQIDETSTGSFDGGNVRLLLPRGFEFTNLNDIEVNFIGGFVGQEGAHASGLQSAPVYTGRDNQEITLTFPTLNSTNVRGTITIDNLHIRATRDASYGQVEMRFRGEISEELVVANYFDYGVAVTVDGDPTEIFAGRYDGVNDLDGDAADDEDLRTFRNSTHELQTLVIREDIGNSWLATRGTSVEFPSWVKVIDVEADPSGGLVLRNVTVDSRNPNIVDIDVTSTDIARRAKLELTFFVAVEGDASGDITALVSGRSLQDEYEVVLGTALAPVEVSTDVTEVKLGLQRQQLNAITLSETEIGSIERGQIVVELEDGFRWNGTPTVEVVDGDITISQSSVRVRGGNDRNRLTFDVTRQSDREAAVIEISGIEVDLWRTLPEGEFMVYVGGDALVQNFESRDKAEEATFSTEWVAEAPFARITTPAPDAGQVREEVRFTIGSTNFMVGNELEAMGVAPYIQNNRTFVPVTFVARALGMDRSSVVWDGTNRTVTIFGDRVVQMEIGSNVMVINGASVTMDAAPEITGDRTFVPIAHAARALGVEYSWDQATQTVTFH